MSETTKIALFVLIAFILGAVTQATGEVWSVGPQELYSNCVEKVTQNTGVRMDDCNKIKK